MLKCHNICFGESLPPVCNVSVYACVRVVVENGSYKRHVYESDFVMYRTQRDGPGLRDDKRRLNTEDALFGTIFRYRTCNPLGLYKGTSKSTLIGPISFLIFEPLIDRSKEARIKIDISVPPDTFLALQTRRRCFRSNSQECPNPCLRLVHDAAAVVKGTGTTRDTLTAVCSLGISARSLMTSSKRNGLTISTYGNTRNGKRNARVTR